jgi:hypothetical protein
VTPRCRLEGMLRRRVASAARQPRAGDLQLRRSALNAAMIGYLL